VVVRSKHVNLVQPVRKRFPRIPYTATNINDAWEMDLADLFPFETMINSNIC